LGFKIVATRGTAKVLSNNGIAVDVVAKVGEGRPNVVDMIKNREIDLIINTPSGGRAQLESSIIRKEAIIRDISFVTTISGAEATVYAIERLKSGSITVKSIQEHHQEVLKKQGITLTLRKD
jgi:carbamoyl-phosphate synthase large subunit